MTSAASGEIDGIDISELRPGLIYELPASLATYLILNHVGEPVDLHTVDRDEERFAVNVQTWRDIAASSATFSRRARSGIKNKQG
jgi:hypothetical protein